MIKLNSTTWKQIVKDNSKDKLEIEIGDVKQPDFKPQMKLMRWDNEVNFSLRAEEKVGATVKEKDGVIKYITPDYEIHQYDKPDASEDGGFEFEWILNKKPISNILKATIQIKGLDFFYQPALTPEEIAEGAQRPENVVGSYAVYHSTKGGMNDAAGMEYKTGKAFHIYRPKAIDANGTEVWGELNYSNGSLTIIVPQLFLDTAVYPVKVDPTFGYTTIGATNNFNAANKIRGFKYALSENGIISSVSIYFTYLDPGANTKVAIYNDSSSYPNTRQGESLAGQLPNTTNWWTWTYVSQPSLNIGDYWLSWAVSSSNNKYHYDTVGSGYNATQAYSSAMPATFPAGATAENNRKVSIYATYTASGGAVATSSRKHTLLMMGVG